jgi:3-deoxy-D-manno-octulosonate 8-phosphate phosphatase KdsC-like HAD superfamily phosphatase
LKLFQYFEMNVKFKKLDCDAHLGNLKADQDLSDFNAKDLLIVFDFDMTLSFMPVIKTKKGLARSIRAELRGGEQTLAALRDWKQQGARFVILTAKVDSKQGAESIVAKLKHLGIQELFQYESDKEIVADEEETSVEKRLEIMASEASIRMAAVGDIIASGHNKPEALRLWVKANEKSLAGRTKLLYVEDCADHVVNFETTFIDSSSNDNNDNDIDNNEQRKQKLIDFKDSILVWWPPPLVEGFETREIHSEKALQILEKRCI